MNKNTTLIPAITAILLAFLIITTGCLPAGNSGLPNATEVTKITKPLNFNDVEIQKDNIEPSNVAISLPTNKTEQALKDNSHSHDEGIENHETNETQIIVEAADQDIADVYEAADIQEVSEAAAKAEIKWLEEQLEAVLTDTSIEYSWGTFDPDTALLQELLGTTVDGIYGNATQRLHIAALGERGLNTDNVPTAPKVVGNPIPTVEEKQEPVTLPSSCSGITCFDGYEGQYQAQVEAAAAALPAELRTAFGRVTVVNGCHPYAKVTFGRCVYGVWDSAGWDANGNHGADWSYTLWVSNRGVESGRLTDIMVHEAGHAYSYVVARGCLNPDTGNTFRVDAREIFGGEELFADGITAYYNGAGAYQNYRGTGTALSAAETDILERMFVTC